jgi:ketosteroid isomerase-like protein
MSVNPMTPIEVFEEFIDAINQRNVDRICRLMTENHLFVDSLGGEFRGRDSMRHGWAAYFSMVPDYAIDIKESMADGQLVIATGMARGTYSPDGKLRPEDAWSTPAAWRAVVEGGCIATWQVYADNEPFREKMRRYLI